MPSCDYCEKNVSAAEYSEENNSCAYCYADNIAHGCQADSVSTAEGWIVELYPSLSPSQMEKAVRTFRAHPYAKNLPLNCDQVEFEGEVTGPDEAGTFRVMDPSTGINWCVDGATDEDVGEVFRFRGWSSDQWVRAI